MKKFDHKLNDRPQYNKGDAKQDIKSDLSNQVSAKEYIEIICYRLQCTGAEKA
jgi:hypothetical protein